MVAMASWMSVGSFVLLVIVLLVVVACLVLLIIKLFEATTGCTGVGTSSSSSLLASVLPGGAISTNSVISLGPNNGSFWGDGRDRDAEFVNRTQLDLKKDAFYNNLKLDGSILNTNGFRLFVAGTLQLLNGSVIQNAGKDGAGNNAFGNGPVPGGLGGAVGTLGGGGNGGNGYLKDGSQANIHGIKSTNALWGTNTTLFSGADGTISSAVLEYGVGIAGKVTTNTARIKFDAAQVLNASFIPTIPMLSGGSGGGGGQGGNQYPGSGGGGGGGVVVICAKNLVVAKGGGSVNVAGGNAGVVNNGGPFNATSGGGGGGGLVLLATSSPESSYEGLSCKVDGGLSVDSLGNSVQASSGRVVNWFQSNETDSNPTQFVVAHSTSPQTLGSAQDQKGVTFQEIDYASSGITSDNEGVKFTVDLSGLYMVSADLLVDSFEFGGVTASVVKNGDPNSQVFGAKNLQSIGKPQTLSLWTVVPLSAKDTFEIRVSPDNPDDHVSVKTPANLAAFLLAPAS